MPVDIALHPIGNPVQGNHPPAPPLPVLQSQTGLAEGANSTPLVVPKTGGVLVLTATAKLRVDLRLTADAGLLNAGASGVVLVTDQPRMFSLPEGSYTLKTLAYV